VTTVFRRQAMPTHLQEMAIADLTRRVRRAVWWGAHLGPAILVPLLIVAIYVIARAG
jgi:hypothetical protein